MDRVRFLLFTAAAMSLLFISGNNQGGYGSSGPSGETDGVTKTTNPHFTGKYCELCHESRPAEGGDPLLKFKGDFTQLCWCHGYTSGAYIHPVDIEPSEEKKSKIPPDFPLRDGKITCLTCHNMYEQCRENRDLRAADSVERKFYKMKIMFLRGDSFKKRTTFCFKCHDEERFKMLDPHNQFDEEGNIIAEKCLYCHKEKPEEKTDTFRDVKLVGDLKMLCQRCHGLYTNHPARTDHFVKPSPKALERMKKLEKDFGIILPLDLHGKMTCVTCHNPHEKGVIPSESAGAKGAGERYRHRLPGKLCRSCHGM